MNHTRGRTLQFMFAVSLAVPFFSRPAEGVFFSKKDRGRHGPAVLQTGVGVRAAGLAESYVGLADDASALYWNPAGIHQTPVQEVLLMRGDSFGGKTQDFLGYLVPFWAAGERRTVGLGFSRLSVDAFDLMEEGQTVGRAEPAESAVEISYAQPVGAVAVGGTVKAVFQELDGQNAKTWAGDFGVLGNSFSNRLTWGASAVNVGPALQGEGIDVPLPLTLRLGGAYRFFSLLRKAQADELIVAAQMDAPNDDLAVGRWGVEYSQSLLSAWRVAVRGGWASRGVGTDSGQWSLGAGVEAGSFRFNFAQLASGELGNETRVDLAVRFGREPAPQIERRQRMEAAKEALARGQLLKAQAAVDQVLAISPSHGPALRLAQQIRDDYANTIDPATLFAQGRKAYDNKDFTRAVGFFRKCVIVSPDFPETKTWLAKSEEAAKQSDLAQTKESVRKARQNEQTKWVRRAETLMLQGEWDGALGQWRKVLSMDGSNAGALSGVSQCRASLRRQAEERQRKGDRTGSLAVYRRLREDDPRDKESDRSIAALEQDMARERALEGKKKYDQGVEAYTAGDVSTARRLFREALELDPEDSAARQALERSESELKQRGKP